MDVTEEHNEETEQSGIGEESSENVMEDNQQTLAFDIAQEVIDSIINDIPSEPTTNEEQVVETPAEENSSNTAGVTCPECNSHADNQQFTKSSFKPKNKRQVCWIYRYRCSKSDCSIWFGPLKRFDRNAFIEVDEDGRPLGRHKRSENHKPSEEKEEIQMHDEESGPSKSSNDQEEDDTEAMNIDTNEDTNEEGEPETGGEEEEATDNSTSENPTARKRRRRKGKPLIMRKKRTVPVEKMTPKKEDKAVIENSPKKKEAFRKPKGYVYVVEPINSEDQEEDQDIQLTRSSRRNQDIKKSDNEKNKEPSKTIESPKSGTRRRNKGKIENSFIPPTTLLNPVKTVEIADACAQTEKSLLLQSACFENLFNDAIREEFEPSIVVRLLDQSMILKKKFVMMAKTIKEQATQIENLRKTQKCYNDLLPKVNEAIKDIRLTYSDKLRRIKADVVEQAGEFRQHHIEVISMLRKNETKYAKLKDEIQLKNADLMTKMERCNAELRKREKEVEYEKERAEYFLWQKDTFEQMKNEANQISRNIEEKLKDTLYIKGNEKCSHCQITERLKKKLTTEMADMTIEREKALCDRQEFETRTQKAERVAQILGQEVDKLNYEIRTWKSQIEKYKEQINTLNANIKELNEKTTNSAKNTPRYGGETPLPSRPSLNTPRSLSTPSSSELERVSPPEDGEITNSTPPGASPMPNRTPKYKEGVSKGNSTSKPDGTAPKIDSGFASWIPKDKINSAAPKVPKLVNAFGIPIKPKPKESDTNSSLPPSALPLPWEKQHLTKTGSAALIAAAAKLEAESFLGLNSETPHNSYNSGTVDLDSLEKKVGRNNDKKEEENSKVDNKRPLPQKNNAAVDDSTSPKKKKKKNNMNRSINPAPSTISSLSNMKKIPKHSDKPPPPGLAKALGIKKDGEDESYKSIPGLSLLDDKGDKTSPNDVQKKIQPAKNKKVNQTPPKVKPWGSPPPTSNRPLNAFGVMSSQQPQREPMERTGSTMQYSSWRDSGPPKRDFFSPTPPPQQQKPQSDRSGFGGSLPWHRESPSFNSAFGEPQSRQEFWGAPNQQQGPPNGSWDRPSFFGRPPDSRPQFPPPRNNMERRSFWD